MTNALTENRDNFKKWHDQFKKERDKHLDNWKLARSTSVELDEMIRQIEQSFDIIESRIKSQRTYGIVFDAKTKNHVTSIDALLNDRICHRLDKRHEYYMKMDTQAKLVNIKEMSDGKSNKVSKITVPYSNWPLAHGTRLNLSHENYGDYIKECQQRHYVIDLVIVIINSADDFTHEDIRILLYHIKEQQYNVILLLNDSPKSDCTYWRECDVCYYHNREFMMKCDLPPDERFLKISAKKIIEKNHDKTSTNSVNFEKAKRIIKEELSMDSVVGRYLTSTQSFMNNFDKIKKAVLEVKIRVENEAVLYKKKLQEKKIETEKTIAESKKMIENKLEKKIKDESKKVTNIDLKFVKNNLEPTFDETLKDFRKDFKKKITEMVKTNNPAIEKYITKMYFKEYMAKGKYEAEFKNALKISLEEVLIELKDSNNKAKKVLERFLKLVKKQVDHTFDSISSSFSNFRDNLKEKVVDKFKNFENTMQSVNEEFSEYLQKDLENNIQRMRPSLETMVANSGRGCESSVADILGEISNELKEMEETNLFPHFMLDYIELRDHASRVSMAIDKQVKATKHEIVSDLEKIGIEHQTKTQSLGNSFQTQYSDEKKLRQFKERVEEIFQQLNLNNQEMYTWEEPSSLVHNAVRRASCGIVEMNIDERNRTVANIEKYRRTHTYAKQFKQRFIKPELMLDIVKKTEMALKSSVNEIIRSIQEDLNDYLDKGLWKTTMTQST